MPSSGSKYLKRAEDYSYNLIQVLDQNIEEVVQFILELEADQDTTADFIRWLLASYDEHKAYTFIASDKFTDSVVGCVSFVQFSYELDSNKQQIYITSKCYIHNQHLKKGVYKKLMNEGAETVLFEHPNAQIVSIGSTKSGPVNTKAGFHHLSDIRKFVLPRWKLGLGHRKIVTKDEINLKILQDAMSEGFQLKSETDTVGFQPTIDAATLKWVSSDPRRRYLLLRLKNDQRSFIVFYIEMTTMIICSCSFANKQSETKLLSFLKNEARSKGFDRIEGWAVKGSNMANCFSHQGFLHNPFTFGPWNERMPVYVYSLLGEPTDAMEDYLDQFAIGSGFHS